MTAQIFVIKDTNAFMANPSFLKYPGHVDDSVCLVLPSREGIDHCAATGVIEEISFSPYAEDERKAFIREYTEFVAHLNIRYKKHFLWWATDISSKNRYVGPLADLLAELSMIDRGLKEHEGMPLLIVAPSIGIYGAVQKLMVKHGRKLFWPQALKKAYLKRVGGMLKSLVMLFVNASRFYARSLWARLALGPYSRRWLSRQKEFYVIKTFSYPNSWDNNGDYKDAFFGRLPQFLSKSTDVLILSFHWQGYRKFIRRVLQEKKLALFPVEFFINGRDIIRAVSKILTFRLRLPKEIFFRGLDVSDILRFELVRTMNGVQVFQLLHYDAVRNMLKRFKMDTFLFTFENNPWERMCMMACRAHSPSTKLIGYQHCVVPEAALNMFVHPLEKNVVPLPDMVLTTGEISKKILQSYGDYSLVPIASACASRYEYLFSIKPPSRRKSQGRILLVLDGIEQTQLMLGFVLEQLGNHSRYRLRIRCHPALPWKILANKFGFDISHYANTEISKSPLREDLEWSDMIIYWQTTVVLEAMSLGKPAINFKTDDILSYDPLFQSDALKYTVTRADSLLDVIKAVENLEQHAYEKQLKEATGYIGRYFYPVTDSALKLFNGIDRKVNHVP